MIATLYEAACNLRDLGVVERPGVADHPYIQWAHELAGLGRGVHDETAWCGSSLVPLCLLLGLSVPKQPARARSWLTAGYPIALAAAEAAFDVVIFKRGPQPQPGPGVLDAPGHVAIFRALMLDDLADDDNTVSVIGGNQANAFGITRLRAADVLGVRRLG